MSAEPVPAAESVVETHPDHDTCANCGTQNRGAYCSSCGQKRVHEGDLGLGHVWHHLLHETLHLDGKVFGSLKLLFSKPGQLTLDFLEGRRARHVHPLRLFLFMSALYFLVSAGPMTRVQWTDEPARHVAPTQILNKVGPRLEAHLRKKAEAEGVSYETFMRNAEARLQVTFKLAFTGAVILNGLWLALLFRHRRPYVAENMIVALHVACFGMAVAMAVDLCQRVIGLSPGHLSALVAVATFGYFFLAARRVYDERGRRIVIAAVLKLVTGFGVMMGALLLFIWRLIS